jgi:hypothetical protein
VFEHRGGQVEGVQRRRPEPATFERASSAKVTAPVPQPASRTRSPARSAGSFAKNARSLRVAHRADEAGIGLVAVGEEL